MKTIWKRIACGWMAVILLCFGVIPVFAVNEYLTHTHFHPVTGSQATAMYENGDGFVLYCYRKGCSNSQYIGAYVLTDWMDTYGADIYGVDVDAKDGGTPAWVWEAMGKTKATLPFVAFVHDRTATAYSPESSMTVFIDALQREFSSCYAAIVHRESVSVQTPPSKTRYLTGEALDTAGLTLRLTHADGTTQIIADGFQCTGFSSDTPGRKTVTVTCGGVQTTFAVRVDTADGKPSVWIGNAAGDRLSFGDSMTLTCDYSNLPEDAQIQWTCTYRTLLGKKTMTGTGERFTLTSKGLSQTVTVYAAMQTADGQPVTDADGNAVTAAQTVRFQNGLSVTIPYYLSLLWQRIQALFGKGDTCS